MTWRWIHKWTAVILALPLLFLTLTGIFLQIRAEVPWIQPPLAIGGSPYQPTLPMDKILLVAKSATQLRVSHWSDIQMLDLRPKSGIVKIRTWQEMEAQIDAKTGAIRSVNQRLNDIVAAMHDGSRWGLRLWVGLPVAMLTLALLTSGLILVWKQTGQKWRGARLRIQAKRQDVSTITAHQPHRPKPWTLRRFAWKYHYWLSLVVLIPWFVVALSGLVLQLRDEIAWVTPKRIQGVSAIPSISFPTIYEAARAVSTTEVKRWEDIWRIYIYPHNGTASVMVRQGARPVETQIDFNTGKVLDVSFRAKDLLEDIHEGKFYNAHLWWFLPTHLVALLLWLTGMLMSFRPARRYQ